MNEIKEQLDNNHEPNRSQLNKGEIMKYLITNTIQYTETILVEADNEDEARDKSYDIEGEKNHDDEVHDFEIEELTDEQWEDFQ